MKTNVVAKFGGTSVKTADAIRQVASIVKCRSELRTVVVSAVGGVTDLLVQFCNCSNQAERTRLIDKLANIHFDLADDLDVPAVQHEIETKLCRLRDVTGLGALTKAQIDHILSVGEDLSCLIVHAFLEHQGFAISRVDAREYIITDDHFGRATPDVGAIRERTQTMAGNLSIIQGFVGSTKDGRTTTLGRGGSDYTAALLAEAMDAAEVLIYTDVPGVYTMDPNVCQSAQVIDELSFQEMEEMASFGAKVLFPATLEPCVRSNIPIRILSTFEPRKLGTRISSSKPAARSKAQVHAVTIRKNQVLVTIKSLKMLNAYGFLANIFSVLSKHKVSVDLITTSEVSVALTIDGGSFGSHGLNPFESEGALAAELSQFAEIVIESELTLIAVIGSGLDVPGMIQKILCVVHKYMIRLVCYGASGSSIGLLVRQEDAVEMARMLHAELVESVSSER